MKWIGAKPEEMREMTREEMDEVLAQAKQDNPSPAAPKAA